MNAPTRPILRYHGGKWKLAPWIVSHFPPHRIYVEPYGGGGSVLLRKPRSYGEIYNDLERDVVNVFRILQDPATAAVLRARLELTAYARDEFDEAYQEPVDKIDRAHKMIVRAFMGFGSASMTRNHVTGFRANSNRSGTTPAQDWVNWPSQVPAFIERLQGVVIENRRATDCMQQHDAEDVLHYVDPPYVEATRSGLGSGSAKHRYRHDMVDDDHVELAEVLRNLKGMVILSGYRGALYDKLFSDWRRIDIEAFADGARPRLECLWLNDACARVQRQPSLLESA